MALLKKQKILIAMDGSKNSDWAFDWYRFNMHRPGNSIIVVCCSQTGDRLARFTKGHLGNADILESFIAEENTKMSNNLLKYQNKLRSALMVGTVITSCHSSPGQMILNASTKHEVSMLIVGANGHGTGSGFVGSVCKYVLAHAHVPVIVCRPPEVYYGTSDGNKPQEIEVESKKTDACSESSSGDNLTLSDVCKYWTSFGGTNNSSVNRNEPSSSYSDLFSMGDNSTERDSPLSGNSRTTEELCSSNDSQSSIDVNFLHSSPVVDANISLPAIPESPIDNLSEPRIPISPDTVNGGDSLSSASNAAVKLSSSQTKGDTTDFNNPPNSLSSPVTDNCDNGARIKGDKYVDSNNGEKQNCENDSERGNCSVEVRDIGARENTGVNGVELDGTGNVSTESNVAVKVSSSQTNGDTTDFNNPQNSLSSPVTDNYDDGAMVKGDTYVDSNSEVKHNCENDSEREMCSVEGLDVGGRGNTGVCGVQLGGTGKGSSESTATEKASSSQTTFGDTTDFNNPPNSLSSPVSDNCDDGAVVKEDNSVDSNGKLIHNSNCKMDREGENCSVEEGLYVVERGNTGANGKQHDGGEKECKSVGDSIPINGNVKSDEDKVVISNDVVDVDTRLT